MWRKGGRGRRMGVALALVVFAAGARSAEAQRIERIVETPRAWLGINLLGADPVGEFGELVDAGGGIQLEGRFPLDRAGYAALRIDAGALIYGRESFDYCFPLPIGCRIGAEVTTSNNILYGGIGPEFSIPGDVSPYVFATAGVSWFETSSSLSGVEDWDEDWFETRHLSDLVGAMRFGGGMRFRVGSTGGGPVAVDLGVEYHRNGVAEYLRKGDILDHPNGAITIFPNRTEANLYTFRAGVSFGLGGYDRGDDHHDHRDKRHRRGRRGR